MAQHQEKARIIRFERLSEHNFRLTLHSPLIAADAGPGQFVMIAAGSGKDPLLRRPFSIHQASSNGHIQIYFRNVGRGTNLLAHCREEEALDVFGPLGRPFLIEDRRPVCLIGGGCGIAPLLFLAKRICQLSRDPEGGVIILGGRTDGDVAPLLPDFRQFGLAVHHATDDGSSGVKGVVMDLLTSEVLASNTMVYACGPELMLAAVHRYCRARRLSCQVSVERVMACGIGACLGCNIEASAGGYLHVCVDGPVFRSEDLVWNS